MELFLDRLHALTSQGPGGTASTLVFAPTICSGAGDLVAPQARAGWPLVQPRARGPQGSPGHWCPPSLPLCSSASHRVLPFPCLLRRGNVNHLEIRREAQAPPGRLYCYRHKERRSGARRDSAGTATIAETPELQHQRFCLPRRFPRPRMSSSCTVPLRCLLAPPATAARL